MNRRLALVALLAAACSKTPEPTPEAKPEPAPATSTAKPKIAEHEIAWDAPPSWQSMPNPNAMRKATYKIGEDTELTVSSAAGGVDANVKRWADQFGAQAKTDKRRINGLDVTVVEVTGAYQGMGGAKKDGYMLLGAVVDGSPMQTFFKMTGPQKVVSDARPDFEKLVASLRPKS